VRDHKGFYLETKSRTKLGNLELVVAQGIGGFLCNQIQQRSQSKKYFFERGCASSYKCCQISMSKNRANMVILLMTNVKFLIVCNLDKLAMLVE
jgi:hypothetical protein